MKKILLSSIVCASVMFAATEYKYEITPMVGGAVKDGNGKLLGNHHVNAGLAFGFNQQDTFFDQVEVGFVNTIKPVEYDCKQGETNVTRVFGNLVKDYELTSGLSAYALAGLGIELFEENAHDNEDGGFGNVGVGLKYKITDRVALKADARFIIETGYGHKTGLYNVGLAVPFGEVSAKPAPVVKKPVVKVAPVVVQPKDSDGDGVIDAKDKCPNTIRGAKVNADGCLTLVDLKINFATNSAKITPNYASRLEAFAKMMNDNKFLKATIKAYTDSVGKASYNKKLSERRAISTVKALKALNVDVSRLKAIGYGETNPVATNKTKEGRAANRRVTATVQR